MQQVKLPDVRRLRVSHHAVSRINELGGDPQLEGARADRIFARLDDAAVTPGQSAAIVAGATGAFLGAVTVAFDRMTGVQTLIFEAATWVRDNTMTDLQWTKVRAQRELGR